MKKIKGKAILIGGTIIAGLAGLFGVIKVSKEFYVEPAVPYSILTDMEKKGFNSKFSFYEGTITGSQVRQLIATVSDNNAPNLGLQVTLKGDNYLWEEIIEEDITTYKATNKLGNSKKYDVKLTYTNEIVSSITIKETVNKDNEITNSLN